MKKNPVSAQVHSINVSGALRSVLFAGRRVTTGFFKTALQGQVCANRLGLEGDAKADLTVHGNQRKRCTSTHANTTQVGSVAGRSAAVTGQLWGTITSEGCWKATSASATYSRSAQSPCKFGSPEVHASSCRFVPEGLT